MCTTAGACLTLRLDQSFIDGEKMCGDGRCTRAKDAQVDARNASASGRTTTAAAARRSFILFITLWKMTSFASSRRARPSALSH